MRRRVAAACVRAGRVLGPGSSFPRKLALDPDRGREWRSGCV